jgi:hypothetical protein
MKLANPTLRQDSKHFDQDFADSQGFEKARGSGGVRMWKGLRLRHSTLAESHCSFSKE